MNAKVLIKFLRALIESTLGKVFLILDNLPVHHAKKIEKVANGINQHCHPVFVASCLQCFDDE